MSVDQQAPCGLDDAAANAREQIARALDALVEHAARDRADAVERALVELRRCADETLEASLTALRTTLAAERAAGDQDWADRLAAERTEMERDWAERLERERARINSEWIEREASELAELERAEVERTADALAALRAGAEEQALRTAEAEESARAAQADRDALVRQFAAERQTVVEVVARLLGHVQDLDGARSLREVLDSLAVALEPEVARGAIFVVRTDELRGWRLIRCGAGAPDVATVAVPLAHAGELATAATSRTALEIRPEVSGHGRASELSFLELDPGHVGMAVPIVVGDRAVAVVYADDVAADGHNAPQAWPEAVELLARHASRCLATITAERAAQRVAQGPHPQAQWTEANDATEARAGAAERHARLLLGELKLYNESAIRLGRSQHDLRTRLRDEIARARRAYYGRVPASIVDREAVFERELVRTLADGDADALGTDIAASA